MSIHPTFPRVGEPWVECDICGFDIPKSRIKRDHLGRLVCARDLDAKDRDSYWLEQETPEEKGFGEPIEEGGEG